MNASFINCCAVPLHYITHSFCPATLNGVLGSCLQKSKFYRGVPEPPGTPPPYAPESYNENGPPARMQICLSPGRETENLFGVALATSSGKGYALLWFPIGIAC